MKKAILVVLLCLAFAGPAQALPFQTIATGTAAPDLAPARPEAFVSADKSFVNVYAYGGLSRTHDYGIAVTSVAVARGTLVARVAWGPPPMPFLVHPGEAVPYHFIRIPRNAIRGRIPRSALLVQVQSGLRARTRVARLVSLVVNAATRLRSATLVGHPEMMPPWVRGSPALLPPTWLLSVDGNAACGSWNAATGYYLVDDASGWMFGCGIP
jgi:hypothetical protein